MSIEFEADSITLDIPFDGLPVGKWTLIPLTSPQVITLSNSSEIINILSNILCFIKQQREINNFSFKCNYMK